MARPKKPKIVLPLHVHCVTSKGKKYYSFHPFRGTARAGKRVKLPGAPTNSNGTPNEEFWDAYRALTGESVKPAIERAGTFTALVKAYKASPEWMELSAKTKALWEPLLGKVNGVWGKLAVRGLEGKHVLALRDRFADTPGAANNMIRALSSMLAWSIHRGWRDGNPCLGLRKLKTGEGYAAWSWEQIAYFRQHAKPEMWHAVALALYTGQRQGDCLTMLWSDMADGMISFTQHKTKKKLRIPMHRDLEVVLESVPKRSLTVLSNSRAKAWTLDGFKSSWRNEFDRPEMQSLNGLVFHGLRKSAVVSLLEAGCTDAEVAAITGQSRQMVEHYGRMVSQERLAAAAMQKWEAGTA